MKKNINWKLIKDICLFIIYLTGVIIVCLPLCYNFYLLHFK